MRKFEVMLSDGDYKRVFEVKNGNERSRKLTLAEFMIDVVDVYDEYEFE